MSAQKSLAEQIRRLASDPDTQSALVSEASCMTGLLTLIKSDTDIEALAISLQALQLLAAVPMNRGKLSSQDGLLLRLACLVKGEYNSTIKMLAQQVLDALQSYVNQPIPSSSSLTPSLSAPSSTLPSSSTPNKRVSISSNVAFKPRYLHHISVRISHCTSKKQQSDLNFSLISIKGVISVTIDSQWIWTIYTSIKEDVLIARVQQVAKQVDEAYVVTKVGGSASVISGNVGVGNENENMSNGVNVVGGAKNPYLAASLLSGKTGSTVSNGSSGYVGSRALVHHTGFEQSSLQGRLQQKQKREQVVEEKAGVIKSVFSSVSSYFW